MISAPDPVRIQAVIDALAPLESQAVYGVFDPARVPALAFEAFDEVSRVSAAVSPDCSYRLVQQAVDAAAHTLDLYIYNVSAQHLVDLLATARDRGVAVRIMVDAMDTNGGERAKLAALGVGLKIAPSTGGRKVFTVCHQKFAVIDGCHLLIGSANWAGTAIPLVKVPGKFKKGNREWLMLVEHTGLAGWFQALFDADWAIPEMAGPAGLAGVEAAAEPLLLEVPMAAFQPPDEVFDILGPALRQPARVLPLLSPDNYFEQVLALIRGATRSIDIEQQYIKLGGPKTRALLEALASRQGEVQVRIIASATFPEAWKQTFDSLEAFGLAGRLRAMNPGYFTHLHNKGVLVDRRISVVSSTNWSENSITQAREAGLVVTSDEVGAYFTGVMDFDWRVAIDPADVPARLADLGDALAALAPDERERIHPADLR